MIVLAPMNQIPEDWKPRLRDLSFGGYDGTMWRWTYHDGSTWAAVLIEDDVIVGWACITKQEEPLPVIGVYIQPSSRGSGKAEKLIKLILDYVKLDSKEIYCVSSNYPKYPLILAKSGYTAVEWE